MILPVFGSPGSIGIRALQVVMALAEMAEGPHVIIATHDSNEFSKTWEARQSDRVIAFSDSPDVELADLFLRAGIPSVAFIEPENSTVEAVWEISCRDLWPARTRAMGLATLHDLILSSNTMVVRSDDIVLPEDLLTKLANHYRLSADRDTIARTAVHLGWNTHPQDQPLFRSDPVPVPEDGPTADTRWREPLAELFSGFAPLLGQQSVDSLSWPLEFFFTSTDDQPGPLLGPVDLTGPARTIIWGPYLNLPAGRWAAEVTFSCAQNYRGCRMAGDIYSNIVHASWEYVLPEEGTYSLNTTFEVTNPRLAIEMRFFLREGVIDGIFNLESVRLTRIS